MRKGKLARLEGDAQMEYCWSRLRSGASRRTHCARWLAERFALFWSLQYTRGV